MNSPTEAPEVTAAPASRGGWLTALLLSLCVSVAIVAPFFWRGIASGHDFEFHATSWLDVAAQWKQDILYPRWTEGANHGFGEPRFLFYPPLSWLLAPALSYVVRWDHVPIAFIILVQTFAGLSAFTFARRVLQRSSALFAAVCYTANPNALLVIYFRSDYAELLASAFFPLLFLTALELAGILGTRGKAWPRVLVFFELIFAAVWLSNAPAAVMATYSMAVLFAWAAAYHKSWTPALRGSAALALGFGLAAFYIVPAAYEQRWVNITQALSPGLLPSENFLYTVTNDPDHTLFNYIASTIAVALMVFTGLAALAARRQLTRIDADPRYQQRWNGQLWNALLVVAAVATTLMLRPTSIVWQLLPKLRFVQFPWRWMSILAIPFVYFVAAAFSGRRFRWLWSIAVASAILGTVVFLVQHTWWDDEEFSTLRATIANGEGFDGTDEYDPIGDDHYNLPAKAPPAQLLPTEDGERQAPEAKSTPPNIRVERWTPEDKTVLVESTRPTRLALRLLDYPAWRFEVNGRKIRPEHTEDSGQVIMNLPRGSSRITARFTRTPDRTIGAIVSFLSVVIAIFLVGFGNRKARAQQLSA
jgi:hypothetical protein